MYNRFFKLVVKIPHCSPPQLMSKALQQALGPLASSLHLDTLSCCIMYPNPINRAILKCVVGRVGTLNRKSKGSKVSMAVCTDYHCARPVSLRSLAISSGIAHRCIAPLPSASIDCIGKYKSLAESVAATVASCSPATNLSSLSAGLLPRASVLDKTQALACCQQISQRPCHLYAALSDRTGSLAGNLTANCAPPAMSEQALRLADDLRRLHISDSDIAAILSPDKSNLHRMCARQVTLRELDYAADVAGLILSESDESNLVIADLSTFMHNCMTVYTHLEDPLYLFCGTPFSRVHLFESPKELAEYAASHQYQVIF